MNQENLNTPMESSNSQISIPPQLPSSNSVLVLGILSIVLGCCAIAGVVLGIIALVQAKKAREMWELNPEKYSESSYKNMNAGKICAIIGLCLSGLSFIYWIAYIVIVGSIVGATAPFGY